MKTINELRKERDLSAKKAEKLEIKIFHRHAEVKRQQKISAISDKNKYFPPKTLEDIKFLHDWLTRVITTTSKALDVLKTEEIEYDKSSAILKSLRDLKHDVIEDINYIQLRLK